MQYNKVRKPLAIHFNFINDSYIDLYIINL